MTCKWFPVGGFIKPMVILFLAALCMACNPQAEDENQSAGFFVFPRDNPWNTDISGYPVHANSSQFIQSIGSETGLHADFGTEWQGAPNGIPFVYVGKDQPMVSISFTLYPEESDPGPYPIPDDAPIEGGPNSDGDRHVLAVDRDNLVLYELYRAFKTSQGWQAGCGARWDLTSNGVRPKYWTSADAAGLPIFPGLVRYEEIEAGEINHALRFTVRRTQRGFVFPARHFASSSTNPNHPPMGLRLRLKADFDISSFSPTNQIILRSLKVYGMFVADNGADWYLSGAPDTRWKDDDLHELTNVKGKHFEVVFTGEIEK